MIHTTIGVYANGDEVINGVSSEGLADHIKYNVCFRPGRALFLDGKCIHRGYLDRDKCNRLEEKFASSENYIVKSDTKPYN